MGVSKEKKYNIYKKWCFKEKGWLKKENTEIQGMVSKEKYWIPKKRGSKSEKKGKTPKKA